MTICGSHSLHQSLGPIRTHLPASTSRYRVACARIKTNPRPEPRICDPVIFSPPLRLFHTQSGEDRPGSGSARPNSLTPTGCRSNLADCDRFRFCRLGTVASSIRTGGHWFGHFQRRDTARILLDLKLVRTTPGLLRHPGCSGLRLADHRSRCGGRPWSDSIDLECEPRGQSATRIRPPDRPGLRR
jgi:hypothetical protein